MARNDNEYNHDGSDGGIESNSSATELANSGGDSGGSPEVIERKRGRPKGSKNRTKVIIGNGNNDDSGEDSGIETTGNETTGTETTKAFVSVQEPKPRKRRKQQLKGIENPGEVSRLVLDKLEQFATTAIGNEGKFQPFERFLLEVGLSDTVSKISPEQAEKVAAIVSPICLIGGIALYSYRIFNTLNEQRKTKAIDGNFDEQLPLPFNENNYEKSFRMSETIVPPMSNLGV